MSCAPLIFAALYGGKGMHRACMLRLRAYVGVVRAC
jgi:hypothetical protein